MSTLARIRCAVAIARFYLRPLRRALARARRGDRGRTLDVVLGPVVVRGHEVVLRTPVAGDAAAWRAARLRERRRIEPWWASDPRSWEDRHTDAAWITGMLQDRQEARAGLALPLVIVIDGLLAGECSLAWIAPHTATAEMSAWLESRWAPEGVSGVAAGLMLDHAMSVLGIHRVIAPIAVGNRAAAWAAVRVRMRKEGRMVGYLEVGGHRLDHDLWAVTADRLPEGGLAAAMRASADSAPRSSNVRAPVPADQP